MHLVCICDCLSSCACTLYSFARTLGTLSGAIRSVTSEPHAILAIQEGKGAIGLNLIFFPYSELVAITQCQDGSEERHCIISARWSAHPEVKGVLRLTPLANVQS